MRNELEVCRLVNECAVLKRELEQKEKTTEDLSKEIAVKSGNDKVLEKRINDRINHKIDMLRKLR